MWIRGLLGKRCSAQLSISGVRKVLSFDHRSSLKYSLHYLEETDSLREGSWDLIQAKSFEAVLRTELGGRGILKTKTKSKQKEQTNEKPGGSNVCAEHGLLGLLGTEALLSPIPCRQDSSLHGLLWFPKGRTVANQRRSSQETIWGRSSSKLGDLPPRTLHLGHSLILSATPPFWNCRKNCLDPYHILLCMTM